MMNRKTLFTGSKRKIPPSEVRGGLREFILNTTNYESG